MPFIASWPGRIAPGTTAATAHSTDLFPTFADLAGADSSGRKLDGVDLLPLLTERTPLPDRTLYWRKSRDRAARQGLWKLCVVGEKPQLYHLGADLGEQIDLAAKHPDRVRQMTAAWQRWEDDVNQSATQFEQ